MVGTLVWSPYKKDGIWLCWSWGLLGGAPVQAQVRFAYTLPEATWQEVQNDQFLVAACSGFGDTWVWLC